jgi:hypothetical protein
MSWRIYIGLAVEKIIVLAKKSNIQNLYSGFPNGKLLMKMLLSCVFRNKWYILYK